jgi:hypothetical protein
MLRIMEKTTQPSLPGHIEAALFEAFGEDDSIVDRLLSLPARPSERSSGAAAWDAAVALRLEQLLGQRMRRRMQASR